MRTTVRIDDDLMSDLKSLSHQRDVSISNVMNNALRIGIEDLKRGGSAQKQVYREKTFKMGKPLVDLTKALQLSAEMEDEAIIEKLRSGK